MDKFYRQNPPREDVALKNILQEISEDYLNLNRENKQKDQKIQELEKIVELSKKIIEQGIQTDELNSQKISTFEKQQKETLKVTLDLAEQLMANLKIQQQQV